MSCSSYLTARERNLCIHLRGGCVVTIAGLAIVDMRKFSYTCEKSNPMLPAHSLNTVIASKCIFILIEHFRKWMIHTELTCVKQCHACVPHDHSCPLLTKGKMYIL